MYLHVKVTPKAKEESLIRKDGSHWLVCVREPAERNLANRRVCALVARELEVAVAQVRIINGHNSPSKLISIQED
ncbi:MAG: hypothetical protein COV10_02635 [Candidatus Vogelbacteria bacterium CG10_big_fil_rev_8_21_14_0_10_51_16]|uniref:DUF167 domain-containing protein n=1 Tax=Candidatus Vogelbacteria bacterium CG10_big_fil_rev_8_21_14_0_10_51_16 TaxID=1975045 RepID=A0A2H0RE60_9BACT|nr:MAG: hypothetical protein COV10_02635 [Candidatus Vogelbacteria bacterium CG10_big_fil_rev_8_21_14_0_10_51_16]